MFASCCSLFLAKIIGGRKRDTRPVSFKCIRSEWQMDAACVRLAAPASRLDVSVCGPSGARTRPPPPFSCRRAGFCFRHWPGAGAVVRLGCKKITAAIPLKEVLRPTGRLLLLVVVVVVLIYLAYISHLKHDCCSSHFWIIKTAPGEKKSAGGVLLLQLLLIMHVYFKGNLQTVERGINGTCGRQKVSEWRNSNPTIRWPIFN